MKITFIRHATAQDRFLYPNDYERVLIKKGKDQARILAQFCQRQNDLPDLFLSSPYPRALETAQIIAKQLPSCLTPQSVDWLRLDRDPEEMIDKIHHMIANNLKNPGNPSLMINQLWLVGHEPNLSWGISQLLRSSQTMIHIKKASMTQLELCSDGRFELLWSIPCQMMRLPEI